MNMKKIEKKKKNEARKIIIIKKIILARRYRFRLKILASLIHLIWRLGLYAELKCISFFFLSFMNINGVKNSCHVLPLQLGASQP